MSIFRYSENLLHSAPSQTLSSILAAMWMFMGLLQPTGTNPEHLLLPCPSPDMQCPLPAGLGHLFPWSEVSRLSMSKKNHPIYSLPGSSFPEEQLGTKLYCSNAAGLMDSGNICESGPFCELQRLVRAHIPFLS